MSVDLSPALWRVAKRAAIVGVIALVMSLIGAWFDAAAFWQAYYIGWLFLIGIGAGCVFNVAVHELTGGRWGLVLRAPLEAAMATVPLLALLALPLAFSLPHIFPWARQADAGASAVLEAKSWWLNTSFFLSRAAVILVIWSVFAILFRRRLLKRRIHDVAQERAVPVAWICVYFVTVTVAAFDWVASLVPEWYSTAIGLRVGVSQCLGAFAYAVPAAMLLAYAERLPPAGRARDFQDLGNLLLTFAMVWAYIAYTEFLIVWAEDLPHETSWFWPRATTSWRALAVALLIIEFALPVFAMLFRAVKTRPAVLGAVCAVVVVGQWLDVVWLVAPSLRPSGFTLHWMDVIVTLALAAFACAWGALALDRQPHALNIARREVLNA